LDTASFSISSNSSWGWSSIAEIRLID
jgi:hypothetical protein